MPSNRLFDADVRHQLHVRTIVHTIVIWKSFGIPKRQRSILEIMVALHLKKLRQYFLIHMH